MTDTTPGPGHNLPSETELLRDRLVDENADLTKRRDELTASVERMPETVEDEGTASKFADMIKLLSTCAKAADDRRKQAKQPYLDAGRTVDGFFSKIAEPVTKAKKTVQGRLDAYARAKAEAERRRREQEAKEAAEAARRAAETAEDDAGLDKAIAAEEAAHEASAATQASNADLSRTRGDYGAVASLRTVWAGEVVDVQQLDLETLRPYLPADALQKALNAYIRAGGRELKGAKIYEKVSTVVR